MRYVDELRVCAELATFTTDDYQRAMDCPIGTASGLMSKMVARGLLDRVFCGRTGVHCVSARGRRMLAKLPAIDPDERCLLIEKVPDEHCTHYDYITLDWVERHGDNTTTYQRQYLCRDCKEIFKVEYVTRADDDGIPS